jgi:hypothetical protein
MSDTNDTVDGLLAEFRGYSAGMPPGYHVTMSWHDFRVMLNRLEAAHERELLTKPAENVNSASASDTAGNSGNAAKLREALERVLCWLKRMNAEPLDTLAVSEFTPSYAVNRTAKSIIEDNDYHISQITAALSAPPRNCDRFASAEEAWDAYDEWVESYRSKGKTEPFNEFGWLFAHATEKEGGAE